MDLWAWLEETIPVGEATALAAALRKKAADSSGDEHSMQHMALCTFYREEAGKRRLLSPLLLHFAKRHLNEAIRTARYYPDPLSERAVMLQRRGDLLEATRQFEEIIPGHRVWIDIFKDPDGSRKEQLCIDLGRAGAGCNVLGRFSDALFWNMEANKEFRQLPAETRSRQTVLEDGILSGTMRALLAQFRYEDALFFVELALKDEMFWAYQSDVRNELRAQKEVLPELVARTKGYEFPKEGLKLWADLIEEVQRCKSADEAREVKRKIMDTIERHKATQQVQDLENAIVALLRKNYDSPAVPPPAQASQPAPPPEPDLSAIDDPELRKTFENINLFNRSMRQDAEQHAAEIAEIVRVGNEAMASLNQAAIANIHERASEIYRVPRWFRVQWNLLAVARLAVKFVALEFVIGKVLEKLLESEGKSVLERLHFGVSECFVTIVVAVMLLFLSRPAEKRIDEMSLRSYKRLLQKLVADRVTTYWATYNDLLRIFTRCKEEAAKLASNRKSSGPEIPPSAAGEKAS